MLVRDVMTTDVATATVDTTVTELIDIMVGHDVTGLPVIDDGRRVVGVVTDADLIAREGFPHRRRPALTAVGELLRGTRNRWWQKAGGLTTGEIMTAPAYTAAPDESLRAVASRMLTLGVKLLPVVDPGGRLVGVVSRHDLLRLFHRTDEPPALDALHHGCELGL